MLDFRSAALLSGRWSPSRLAVGASTWAWYDFSDLSTMFQDSLGSTPVTAVEQPIGLILDKSRGLALGNELVANPGYDSDTVWSKGTDWAISGGVASRGPSAGGSSVSQTVTLTAGVTYRVEYTITNYVAGNFRARFTGGTAVDGTARSAAGTYVEYFVALTGNNTVAISANTAATSGSVDNISVREVPGWHATQATAAARPIYRVDGSGRGYGFFDGTDDSLATGTITPGAVDKAQVFTGVRKLSDAAIGVVVESSPTSVTNPGVILMRAPRGVAPSYGFGSTGTLFSEGLVNSGYAAPITNVLTGLGDISGDRSTLRINGSQINQSTADQGTGDYLAYSLFIGARAGTSFFFNGWVYNLIVRFSATNLDASIIANAERWMNGKTGAY
jgi:hypothetical protein